MSGGGAGCGEVAHEGGIDLHGTPGIPSRDSRKRR
jgi:hypothetical protein